jgi:hypothetical protein
VQSFAYARGGWHRYVGRFDILPTIFDHNPIFSVEIFLSP